MNKQSVVSKTPLIVTEHPEAKRQEIKEYFNKTFELYEDLFTVIKDDHSYFSKPEPLRHPLIFYFGHTATFFVNKLITANIITERINPDFESKFAIGVDEMSWDDLDDTNYDWPRVDQVKDYRAKVKQMVNQVIDTMPMSPMILQEDDAWVVLMGIEHERIHLETSSVIIRQLPLNEVQPVGIWTHLAPTAKDAPINKLLPVKGKIVELGKKDLTYGWDNEFGKERLSIKAFEASKYLTSNQEFLEFVKAEGYQDSSWWCEEGQSWLASIKPSAPRFWIPNEGGFKLRLMAEEIPLPMNWPVEINYYEAKAFCAWKSVQLGKGVRMPSEAEWYVLRDLISEDALEWEEAPGNINLEHYTSPNPVDMFMEQGFGDIIGNVWQWTETPILGFEGFKVHPVYDDFSVPTFDGEHHLIKGGSWISTGNEAIKSARYAFRKHFYQHAGFRYVVGAPLEKMQLSKNNTYESSELVNQYLEFHYGSEFFGVENYPKQCAELVMKYVNELNIPKKKALDLGCAVGRASFELNQGFDRVTGIDFTARFIEKAEELLERGKLSYLSKLEGEIHEEKSYKLDKTLSTKGLDFWQGDACNLKPQFTGYDVIFCGNLIDRLYDPRKFLKDIKERLNGGGLLVLTSPYTWLEEYTRKENWLGGFEKDGKAVFTVDGLKASLSEDFQFVAQKDVPFVIKETRRKFQHTLADMTVWQKKS